MTFYSSKSDQILTTSITQNAIVLDIDETLVHTCENMEKMQRLGLLTNPNLLDLRKRSYIIPIDDVVEKRGSGIKTQLWGITRPYLEEFLIFCFSYFKIVAIWSAGQPKYVNAIVDSIFKDIASPHVIYSRDHCIDYSGSFTKPLSNMISQIPGLDNIMSLSNTIIIDDRLTNFAHNPENGILIPPYSPRFNINDLRKNDTCLLQLKDWLNSSNVTMSNDLRILDKSKIFNQTKDNLSFYEDIEYDTSIISNNLFQNDIFNSKYLSSSVPSYFLQPNNSNFSKSWPKSILSIS